MKVIKFKCNNTACGRVISLRVPQKAGIFKCVCPTCKKEMFIKFSQETINRLNN